MENDRDRTAELEAFKQHQQRALEEFEARQRNQLTEFETEERRALQEFERREGRPFEIKIDRRMYEVRHHVRTGSELRALPAPPIGADRDLFEVIPGGTDRKISNDEQVRIRDGLRFFTAPAQINPGNRPS